MKFQVRKSRDRDTFQIVNTRPENGRRWSVVGRAIDAANAIEYAEALNRQDKRLAEATK